MPRKDIDRLVGRFKPGSRTIPARQLNSLVEGVNRVLSGVNAPTQPRPYGKSGGGGGGSPVLVLVLVSHEDDYLVCSNGSSTVYVAKHFELQRTPFDGETIAGIQYDYGSGFASSQSRIATELANPSVFEEQYITPLYRSGDEIYALKTGNGTGVPDPDNPSQTLEYIEMGQGRAFAYVPPEE